MNEIIAKNGKEMTKDQIELIKRTVAKGAGDDEFAMFMYLAKEYALDPFLKEICFIKRRVWNPYKNGWDEVPSIMTTRDGFLAIAHRTGQFGGIESDVIYDDKGILDGAWCKVWNKSFQQPVSVKVKFREYCAYNKEGKPQALWSSKPEMMVKKVAESQALRKAFNIKGIYGEEEMQAEIQKDTKTELEYASEAINLTEKQLSSPEDYDKWSEEIRTEIIDAVFSCKTEQDFRSVESKYKTDISRLLDKDRGQIKDIMDSQWQAIISGETLEEQAEIEAETPLTAPKTEKPDPITQLVEKEAFGKEWVPLAVKEITTIKTIPELNVWKSKNAGNMKRVEQIQKEYIDALLSAKYSKITKK